METIDSNLLYLQTNFKKGIGPRLILRIHKLTLIITLSFNFGKLNILLWEKIDFEARFLENVAAKLEN